MAHTQTNLEPLARVDGWPIHVPNLSVALTSIIDRAQAGGTGFTVFTLNLDHIVKLRANHAFRDVYRKADFVTADGAPVAWLGRCLKSRETTSASSKVSLERTTGADLFVPLSIAAANAGLPVYLFGSSHPVLAKAAEALKEASHGRIDIAGIAGPSADFDPFGTEADAAIAAIAASGAKLCFVALSPPKNELFAARAVAANVACGFICVGAAVDFVAGKQIRAPSIAQRWALEWAWRLACDPRRLARRYFSCATVLVELTLSAAYWNVSGTRTQ